MSKESGERTLRPIFDLTPLSPTTSFTYIPEYRQALFLTEDYFFPKSQIKQSFIKQNEELYFSVESTARWLESNGNFGNAYMLGSLAMYRYITAEATLRGGCLPHIDSHVIERYERDLYGDINFEHLEKMRKKGQILEAEAISDDLLSNKRPDLFFEFADSEPQTTEMIHLHCRTLPPSIEAAVYDGAIAVHASFKLRQEIENVRRMVKKKTK